jgi:hypothetical protein
MMIRTDAEYRRTIARITECHLAIVDRCDELRSAGSSCDDADPTLREWQTLQRMLEDQIARYESGVPRNWAPAV